MCAYRPICGSSITCAGRMGCDLRLGEVEARHLVGMTAFNFRFHPHLRLVKDLLEQDAIGRPYCLRSECGSYLSRVAPHRRLPYGVQCPARAGGRNPRAIQESI